MITANPRARGEDEPPTIEVALESGDEAAVASNQVRELGDTVEALTAELKATRAALRQAENELEREQVRSSWLAELAHTKATPAPNTRPAAGPNRAQRRKAERKRHRSP